MRILKLLPVAGLLLAACSTAGAGMITVSRINTDDIVIPTFDPGLGTLTDVSLTVVLRDGATSLGGAHDHGTYTILSENTRGNTSVGSFSTSTMGTTSVGDHAHSVLTPSYSGGGITVGTFGVSLDPAGGHNHGAVISYNGLQQVGPTSWVARAVIDLTANGGHVASYGSTANVLSFSGGGVAPFLGGSDIMIAADAISTSTFGAHNHLVSSFSRTVSSSTGPWTWNFNSSTAPLAGAHSMLLDPRFDTIATFTFIEPVPEPSGMALLGMGGLTLLGYGRRRQRLLRLAAA